MLTGSASLPTARSSVPHQRQDTHKALADLALLTLCYAEIAVCLSSCPDHVSKAGHSLLFKRRASVKATYSDPARERRPVDRCSFHEPWSTTAVEGSSGLRRELTISGSTGRGSWCSRGSR